MVETERTTFSVTTTGVGRPDYSPAVAASKLITGLLQTAFIATWDFNLAAESNTTVPLYDVPSGYKLNIGSMQMNCDRSIIQEIQLYGRLGGLGGTITWLTRSLRYDMHGEVSFGPESSAELVATDRLYVELYNNDSISRRMSGSIQGFLERVE